MTNLQTKEAIDNAIRHFTELHEAKNQIIINQLEGINNHLIRQNGTIADTIKRLASIEGDHARRELICPHRQSINQLLQHKNEITTIKKYVRNWVLIATAIANTLIGLFAWFINRGQ